MVILNEKLTIRIFMSSLSILRSLVKVKKTFGFMLYNIRITISREYRHLGCFPRQVLTQRDVLWSISRHIHNPEAWHPVEVDKKKSAMNIEIHSLTTNLNQTTFIAEFISVVFFNTSYSFSFHKATSVTWFWICLLSVWSPSKGLSAFGFCEAFACLNL